MREAYSHFLALEHSGAHSYSFDRYRLDKNATVANTKHCVQWQELDIDNGMWRPRFERTRESVPIKTRAVCALVFALRSTCNLLPNHYHHRRLTSFTYIRMAARRFVVFQDTPEAPSLPASTATHPPPNVLGPTTSEKENIHPLTGRAAFASKSSTQGTKEKITVLSTKFSVEDSVLKKKKKLVASDAGEDGLPEAKKLKASLSNGVPAKTKKSTGQRTTTSARPRKPTRRNVLPSLEEGAGDEETRVDSTQASINSRCVELTVKSLADVSEAFETTSAAATSTCSVESSESGNPLNLSTVRPVIIILAPILTPLFPERQTP